MSWFSKVAWKEGLFLQPQHLQQADRYHEHLVNARTRLITPYPWGVGELVLAKQLQAQAPLRFIDNALRNRGNVRVTPLAYCFCTLQ